ncbi:PREDICTED: snRNA-activating protein complex subunit 1-like isoform X1 [Priapulus caudatus]|uniref:snRNA-activating protein complex subunit 1-like isoform X1 n=1 Tax=Priapulus caudatus TaxID=37621 RepID=A0ABM1E368_PRICU|nr:PREDICTED: snRNA-activating protein complex subunit 1-like isoform X1 [Priapulus caudatus]XP_014666631.1 PREDICTED: snRNA-activating protein complex subunit 1-like isoform X1 [Priapulus caudatus]XP_014666639.1 PREDICTED: snRNA-activating protein complex subunit 1-like isoform X1 [Priapulus caudatus]
MRLDETAQMSVTRVVRTIPSYLAAGFQTDYEKLLSRFAVTGSVRYEEFAKIWKEMRFPLIFCGRSSQKELCLFASECLSAAQKLMQPLYTLQARVGALYLLYGLYFIQPLDPRERVRVTLQQWKELIELESILVEQQHHDARFCLLKMKIDEAFLFVATTTEMGPLSLKVNTELDGIAEDLKAQKSELTELTQTDSFEQLEAIHNQYQSMKRALCGPDASAPDFSLNVVHKNIAAVIGRTVAERATDRKRTYRRDEPLMSEEDEVIDEYEDERVPRSSTADKRMAIKKKAMNLVPTAPKDRRHRQAKATSSPQRNAKRATRPRLKPTELPTEEEMEGKTTLSMPTFHVETECKKRGRKSAKAKASSRIGSPKKDKSSVKPISENVKSHRGKEDASASSLATSPTVEPNPPKRRRKGKQPVLHASELLVKREKPAKKSKPTKKTKASCK